MPSVFSELESRVSNAIDGLFGEETRIVPQVRGEYFGTAAAGGFFDVTGIVDINPVTVMAQDQGNMDGMQPILSGETYHVSYDLSLFAASTIKPKKGDLIYTVTHDDGMDLTAIKGVPLAQILALGLDAYVMTLKIEDVQPDGIGRVVCRCAREK